ncbi:MAG: hypothetical protein IJ772_04985 [Bacilli bacterium]|nr:hypothetical protein [Bacilli bacterium]
MNDLGDLHPLFLEIALYLRSCKFDDDEIEDILNQFYIHFIKCIKNSKKYKDGKREFNFDDLLEFIEFYNKTDVPEKIKLTVEQLDGKIILFDRINRSIKRVDENIDFKFDLGDYYGIIRK